MVVQICNSLHAILARIYLFEEMDPFLEIAVLQSSTEFLSNVQSGTFLLLEKLKQVCACVETEERFAQRC